MSQRDKGLSLGFQCAVERARRSSGGRYPTRQLLLQPEAVGAWRTGNSPARSLRCKRSSAAGSASTQPLMRMNTEQASKRAMWTPSLLKQDEGRSLGVKRATAAAPRAAGVWVRGCEQRINAVNTGGPSWWGARPQLKNREVWNRPAGESERFIVAKNRVTIEERRDLSSRSTQKQQEPGRLTSVCSLPTPLRLDRCRERCMPQRRHAVSAACRVRRLDTLSESRMRASCMSGLMSGIWKRGLRNRARSRLYTPGPSREEHRPESGRRKCDRYFTLLMSDA